MNEYSQRIVKRMNMIIEDYLSGNIDQKPMLNLVEGSINALEDIDLVKRLNKFLTIVNDSIYLYNKDEGKLKLKNEFKELKNELENY